MARVACWVAWLTLLAVVPVQAQDAGDYVRITVPVANIRTGPSTSSRVVGQATWDQTFEWKGQDGDWFQINMFSGEYRWVHNSVASRTNRVQDYPSSVARRRSIFEAMTRAQDRAVQEAEERYPADFERAIDLERLLYDRYQLDVANAADFAVVYWPRLRSEGVRRGWVPPRE